VKPLAALPIAASGFAAMTVPAGAGDCPGQGPEGREQAISAAPSCQEAAALFKRCAIGGLLDGSLALQVEEVCEKHGEAALPAAKREAFEAEIQGCNKQYAKKKGAMYRSLTAFCHVEAMERYAQGRRLPGIWAGPALRLQPPP
jgi:hypothetical protein